MSSSNLRTASLLSVACALACAGPERFETPLPDDGTFASRPATEDEQARCELAAEYGEAHNGRTVLMLQGDELFCEAQLKGNEEPTPYPLWSGTKTFWCALSASLVEEGEIDLDETVADTLTEWQGDPLRSRITVRHLLQFTSGLARDKSGLSYDGFKAPEHQRVEDRYQLAVDQPGVTEPGAHFEYGSQHLFAFGAFVKRKLDREPLELLEERVLDPIGFRYAGWNKDSLGQAALPYGAWSTAREWAKFLVLLKDRGAWQGEQLLDAERLDECLQGSAANPGYGMTTWLNSPTSQAELDALDISFPKSDGPGGVIYEDGPNNMWLVAGGTNTRAYVFPDDDLIIMHLGDGNFGYDEGDFLARAYDGVVRAREGRGGGSDAE